MKTVVDFATQAQCETLVADRDIYGLQCCSTLGGGRRGACGSCTGAGRSTRSAAAMGRQGAWRQWWTMRRVGFVYTYSHCDSPASASGPGMPCEPGSRSPTVLQSGPACHVLSCTCPILSYPARGPPIVSDPAVGVHLPGSRGPCPIRQSGSTCSVVWADLSGSRDPPVVSDPAVGAHLSCPIRQ